MEAENKPPVIFTLLKSYAGIYRAKKRNDWLHENKLLMPTYGYVMFADMDSMFANIGVGSLDFWTNNRVQVGNDASELALASWNNTIQTFASSKIHTDGLVHHNAPDTPVCRLASFAVPIGLPQGAQPLRFVVSLVQPAPSKNNGTCSSDEKNSALLLIRRIFYSISVRIKVALLLPLSSRI